MPLSLPRGPGLAKARVPPLLAVTHGSRVRPFEGRWKELFERADTVSEGAPRAYDGKPVWYGMTSIILSLPDTMGTAERAFIVAVAANDLHVRLRAVRLARREALSRAPAQMGRSSCEIQVSLDPAGVRIDVDIQAPLIEGARGKVRSGA